MPKKTITQTIDDLKQRIQDRKENAWEAKFTVLSELATILQREGAVLVGEPIAPTDPGILDAVKLERDNAVVDRDKAIEAGQALAEAVTRHEGILATIRTDAKAAQAKCESATACEDNTACTMLLSKILTDITAELGPEAAPPAE